MESTVETPHFYWPLWQKEFSFLPIVSNLNREKFGSEVRPGLVGKYEQNLPLIFHLFLISRLIVDFHYSGASHLKSSFFVYTLDICSSLILYQSKLRKKERVKSKPVRIWLARKVIKPFSYNHIFFNYMDLIPPLSLVSLNQIFETWQLCKLYLDKGLQKLRLATFCM